MSVINAGVLVDKKVKQQIYTGLEKGKMSKVNGVVIHQTGAATAQHTFNSYAKGGHGAHFLIDKAGLIYQTAHVDQKTHHVGKIKSRCYQTKVCTPQELQAVSQILFKPKTSYSKRVRNVHRFELSKPYPERYPSNDDSLGIEIVGDFRNNRYEAISSLQNQSLKWLLGELYQHFKVSSADVYRHPQISYKQPSEAKTASW